MNYSRTIIPNQCERFFQYLKAIFFIIPNRFRPKEIVQTFIESYRSEILYAFPRTTPK